MAVFRQISSTSNDPQKLGFWDVVIDRGYGGVCHNSFFLFIKAIIILKKKVKLILLSLCTWNFDVVVLCVSIWLLLWISFSLLTRTNVGRNIYREFSILLLCSVCFTIKMLLCGFLALCHYFTSLPKLYFDRVLKFFDSSPTTSNSELWDWGSFSFTLMLAFKPLILSSNLPNNENGQ